MIVWFLFYYCYYLFFSCNYFSQGEITTLGSGGGSEIIRDVVVGMVETQLFFFSGNNPVAVWYILIYYEYCGMLCFYDVIWNGLRYSVMSVLPKLVYAIKFVNVNNQQNLFVERNSTR